MRESWSPQFAYYSYVQKHVQTCCIMTKCRQRVYWAGSRTERLGSSVRFPIFDFLSALNTIQPLLLRQELGAIQPDNAEVSWIIDYLPDRPQFVPSPPARYIGFAAAERHCALTFLIHTLPLTWTQPRVTPPPDFL